LDNDQSSRSYTESKVDADVLAHTRVTHVSLVHFRPMLEPHAATCEMSVVDQKMRK
jgi:hypothetical protein